MWCERAMQCICVGLEGVAITLIMMIMVIIGTTMIIVTMVIQHGWSVSIIIRFITPMIIENAYLKKEFNRITQMGGGWLLITVRSHEHHAVPNHRQLVGLLKGLFWTTTKKSSSNSHMTGPLWGENNRWPADYPHKVESVSKLWRLYISDHETINC